MFANAIEKVSMFTRPVKFIMRNFGSKDIIPGTATLFFINENGVAITCKHVTDELLKCSPINQKYEKYKTEINALPVKGDSITVSIAKKYGYTDGVTLQYKSMFFDCVETDDNSISFNIVAHPKYDLSIIRMQGIKSIRYSGHAIFAKDSTILRRGDFLCRYGYPFSEFSDYEYDATIDEIRWTNSGKIGTPAFPIEGMYTRNVVDADANIYEYELSTPGLRGQSGGPLFDANGIVFGMQSETTFFHLGFDQDNARVRIGGHIREVENHPFLHVGRCITVDVIKDFLDKNKIKYYIGDSTGLVETVNGEADE